MTFPLGTDQHVARTKAGGRQAVSDAEKQARAARLRSLRSSTSVMLGKDPDDLSQEAFAERAAGLLERVYVVRFESGDNAASTAKMQEGLAKACGGRLTAADVARYLDGKIDLAALERIRDQASLAEVVADHPNRWTKEVVRGVEGNTYAGGIPQQGWKQALDDVLAVTSAEMPFGKGAVVGKAAPVAGKRKR